LAPYFEEVFRAYETSQFSYNIASHKFLALLYQLKESSIIQHQQENVLLSAQQILTGKFLILVNMNYLDKRTVEEYAELLTVSSSYLSKSVRSVTAKNALLHINERILKEAKLMIKFTDLNISEIAFHLNFTDTSNFGKFFRKYTNSTPLAFRTFEKP
jgi:AraC family transcriptional activator of pobA